MNSRHLAYFLRIADLGSFTKAAQHLHVAQPALTRHIHQLEAKFGIELFFRSSRGVVLTEAGKHLYDNATRVLRDIERTSDEMRAFTGAPSGKIVLGVTPSLCPVVVPTLLARRQRELSAIQLKIVESYGAQLENWLIERQIDLAIHTEPEMNKLLACTSLVSEEMVLVTRPERGSGAPVSAKELRSIPLTMTDSLQIIVERLLEPLNVSLLVDTTLNAIPTILLMVKGGLCASILPYSAARSDAESGLLRAHRVTERGLARNLVLSACAARPMSGATLAVANVVRSVFEELANEGAFRLSICPQ
jgi:LysR family nitrogen assimilation transcriptional regulator